MGKKRGFFFLKSFRVEGRIGLTTLGCAESMLNGSEGKNIRNLKA